MVQSQELRIGAVARQAGVSVDTVRYYERRGLLRPAGRLPSGYRLYTEPPSRGSGWPASCRAWA